MFWKNSCIFITHLSSKMPRKKNLSEITSNGRKAIELFTKLAYVEATEFR